MPLDNTSANAVLVEARGLLALVTLLVLPGLLVARAPWTAVPFLSASFWVVSWWWPPCVAGTRSGFLRAALLFFLLLALVRLLKPLAIARPSWPAALVLVAAAARLAPMAIWPVAPGADMSLHSLSTLLLVWRDGIPASYEPLLPIHAFGAYTPGLHGLAADVSLLSGLPAHRSAFLVAVAAYGLLQVALFALLARLFPPAVAATSAVLALGMARVPQALFGWGGNTSVLALAFLVAAAALLATGMSRLPAVAAGAFVGAAVVSHTLIAGLAMLAIPLAAHLVWRAPPGGRPRVASRFAIAAFVALLVAGPYLLQLDYTLSEGERAWLADHLRTHYAADWQRYARFYPLAVLRYVVASLNDAFLACALAGAVLGWRRQAPALGAAGMTVALLVTLAGTARWGGLGPAIVFPERPMLLVFVVLAATFAFLVASLLGRSSPGPGRSSGLGHEPAKVLPWLAPIALAVLAGIAVERTHRYYLGGAANVMVGKDDLEAMAWIATHTRPADVVCNDYRTAGLWVPALAGRSISDPQIPPFYFDEFRAGASGRQCALTYVAGRWFFGPPQPVPHLGRVLFRNASVALVESKAGAGHTTFHKPRENLDLRVP